MLDAKLNTLLTVYELGSYSRAAEKLSLTQPAVSHHMKQLESSLGVKVFLRRENELKITRDGEIVIKYAKRMAALYENLIQALKDDKSRTIHLSVGLVRSDEGNFLPEVLSAFGNRNEGAVIKIVAAAKSDVYNMLKTYELDLAIIEGGADIAGFSKLLLDRDSLCLAVSRNSPLASQDMVNLQDIKHEKMILGLPNSGARSLFESYLEENNGSIDDFNIALEINDISMIKQLVKNGMGVAILTRGSCLDEVRRKEIVTKQIEGVEVSRDINLFYHNDFSRPDILKGILRTYNDMLRAYQSKGERQKCSV